MLHAALFFAALSAVFGAGFLFAGMLAAGSDRPHPRRDRRPFEPRGSRGRR